MKEEYDYIKINYERYSRINQSTQLEFSKQTYPFYWLKLILHLDYWTNAIYTKWLPNGRRIYAKNIEHLMTITTASKTTVYQFYNDISQRHYISKWNSAKLGEVYVLNPKYVVNGGKVLSEVYFLFYPDEISNEHNLQDTTRSYKAYLSSTEWQEKRELVLKRDKCCQHCNSTDNLLVHHITYEHIFHEHMEDLITLCKKCHFKEHPELLNKIQQSQNGDCQL
ncbi:hypothetical protein LCGC14_1823690 [marine sediment metagenome]|uniref:HNH nuclease domain-containing protein n=1 Tax=marine sediment metagenome TaxID=412755 RepID=A0A0F9GI88_9ZZZZ